MKTKTLITLGLVILLANCATTTGSLSQKDVHLYGKKVYQAKYSVVFEAAKDSVENIGFATVITDKKTGKIVTSRKAIGEALDSRSKTNKTVYKQYEIRFQKVTDGIQVVAKPRLFLNENEQSYGEVIWSRSDECEQWDALFQEMTRLVNYDW